MGEDEVMDEEEDVDNVVTKRYINITDSKSCDNNILTYSLAKRPPHQSLTAEKITEIFGTTNLSEDTTVHLPLLLSFPPPPTVPDTSPHTND